MRSLLGALMVAGFGGLAAGQCATNQQQTYSQSCGCSTASNSCYSTCYQQTNSRCGQTSTCSMSNRLPYTGYCCQAQAQAVVTYVVQPQPQAQSPCCTGCSNPCQTSYGQTATYGSYGTGQQQTYGSAYGTGYGQQQTAYVYPQQQQSAYQSSGYNQNAYQPTYSNQYATSQYGTSGSYQPTYSQYGTTGQYASQYGQQPQQQQYQYGQTQQYGQAQNYGVAGYGSSSYYPQGRRSQYISTGASGACAKGVVGAGDWCGGGCQSACTANSVCGSITGSPDPNSWTAQSTGQEPLICRCNDGFYRDDNNKACTPSGQFSSSNISPGASGTAYGNGGYVFGRRRRRRSLRMQA